MVHRLDSHAEAPDSRAYVDALLAGALPGEVFDLPERAINDIIAFIRIAADQRTGDGAEIELGARLSSAGERRTRLAVVNDDMPFLVDSVAGVLTARGLTIERLLHPIVDVVRDGDGRLVSVQPAQGAAPGAGKRESWIFIETERADARTRAAIAQELRDVLGDVRAAVSDWKPMLARLEAAAEGIDDAEGAAFLRWLAQHNFTLLSAIDLDVSGRAFSSPLGVLTRDDASLPWSGAAADAALGALSNPATPLLIAKADEQATVHRRSPYDLIVVPRRGANGQLSGVSVFAGLFTSQALATSPAEVPLIRERVRRLTDRLGFTPTSHAGKTLAHVVDTLPHDLLFEVSPDQLADIALTAMSLIDRPRPRLLVVPDPLGRHSTVLVWLPGNDYSAERAAAIGRLLETGLGGTLASSAAELREGPLVSMRYVIVHPTGTGDSAEVLDARLRDMVRGWVPAVEGALRAHVSPQRAARFAITYGNGFGPAYRSHFRPEEAAIDIIRLDRLNGPDDRDVRICPDDEPGRLRLNIYRAGDIIALSDAVPVLEHFGFRVIEEMPHELGEGGALGWIHQFSVEPADPAFDLDRDGQAVEEALRAVLTGVDENDAFNALMVRARIDRRGVTLLRAWFRYLRQTGSSYGLDTVVEALAGGHGVAAALLALFNARHDPHLADREATEAAALVAMDAGLARVTSIDEDRILRLFRAVIDACLRTNAFVDGGPEALAFKVDPARIPGLPKPVPYREIFVYSIRVEGVHLRGGPVARGGLRWSDRRDDFRTEILGLIKAQLVKNAVIVPTGAKGGFYAKQLPPPTDREAWLAEGTEAYRIYIRALLSVTDNIVDGAVVPPADVHRLDGDDAYLVVAADKGTAAFSDVANAIAVAHNFWLGDAFASGGSHGYDHKAMAITARGAWVSVTRHFAELGVDVQTDPIRVAGCGDMSGDVFGNGMLLSKSLKLVAAFDHRHIFLDPAPDPVASWAERKRLFDLPRSSWADYDRALISAGGGVFGRDQKAIPLSPEVQAMLGLGAESASPSELISAILKSQVDLLWFGGIGTYIKGAAETNAEVGDRANDAHRVNGRDVRARVLGEGANLGVTQAGRVDYALTGGRLNTDFIDNSAGVDCSDNEVNIKIALGRDVASGALGFDDRNRLLAEMTDAVAGLVLEDNRLQTQALSIAERGGARAVSALVRTIQTLEASGRLDRAVEGLPSDDQLGIRAQGGQGLMRPELAVLLAYAKLALQDAIEHSLDPDDTVLEPTLIAAFPPQMAARHRDAILAHRLRGPIVATKLANRIVNRLGITPPFAIAEQEGTSLGHVANAYAGVSALFDLPALWAAIEGDDAPAQAKLTLLVAAASAASQHLSDMVRITGPNDQPAAMVARLAGGLRRLDAALDGTVSREAMARIDTFTTQLGETGGSSAVIRAIVRLGAMDGAIGLAALAAESGLDEVKLAEAYVRLGDALSIDWAKSAAITLDPTDPWERLLVAGVARDLEQLRLDLLGRIATKEQPLAAVEHWLVEHAPRVEQLRARAARARAGGVVTPTILAQLSSQARAVMTR